ncbi:hypothetical protein BFJ68_g16544 [Fusarium oxysporum]|uniref:Cytochrome P450 n=2 Tax=Fusarium oxysporum TaxID=5507 RepID=A0A420MBE8_FUSOX|nr:hypothetical protein BFJ65_g18512 [Fusarium oxysporum f. sp. cepae]RKK26700.1 hypothetical protein BFJ67_g16511 [Fusarium oxysporum f. sp. cepae]RKK65337.1 hypothetical protein BFJ69_g16378 [Fusarium oxysporum]RKK90092.1 hypothetical protein BFJ68_g16544 [Fusarium oxysporum]
MRKPLETILEGNSKSKNGLFRIATLQGEYIIVTDRHKVAEYVKAPDTILNSQDGANDQQQIPLTMGYGVGHRTYHNPVVRGPVTKNIEPKTQIMLDEAMDAITTYIGSPSDYTEISLYDAIALTVARISNRYFIGPEFCRNEEYLKNAADYAQAVVISAEILRLFPSWFKPLLVKFLPVMKYRRKGYEFLKDFIQERLDGKLDENGNRPDDLVQWLIDAAPPIEKNVPMLSERVMALNVAAIHTTTMTFTAALYTLAAEPEKYLEPLRQEVFDNLNNGKLTYQTIQNLHKMDSFLRESARFNNAGLMSLQRNARKEFRFADGTVIPAGSRLGAPGVLLQNDAEVYDKPEEFDGFRFCGPAYAGRKDQTAVATSTNLFLFGHGRHPCPGRYLAVHEMKLMFSTLLLKYDFKLADGTAPGPWFLGTMVIPDTTLKVLFKAREV